MKWKIFAIVEYCIIKCAEHLMMSGLPNLYVFKSIKLTDHDIDASIKLTDHYINASSL